MNLKSDIEKLKQQNRSYSNCLSKDIQSKNETALPEVYFLTLKEGHLLTSTIEKIVSEDGVRIPKGSTLHFVRLEQNSNGTNNVIVDYMTREKNYRIRYKTKDVTEYKPS